MVSIIKILGFSSKNYGVQIGKTAKNGSSCFLKKSHGQDVFTTLDKSGSLVQSKVVNHITPNYTVGYTKNLKGDVISKFEKIVEPLFSSTNNRFAKKIRNIHTEYNRFGQKTLSSDKTFSPLMNKLKATVFSNTNGIVSKTYINTADNSKFTIKCVDTQSK